MEAKMKKESTLTSRVLKAMGVFSGVQVMTILCSVVRAKMIAVWIGAVGVGLFGVYNSAIDMISMITLLGVGGSAVRDIAAHSDDEKRLTHTATVVRRWCLFLGLIGAVVMFAGAPLISELSFGDASKSWVYRLFSVTVFLMAFKESQQAVLQGMRRLAALAKGSLWGAVAGVAVAAPLFYFLGVRSIPWAITATAAAMALSLWIAGRNSQPRNVALAVRDTIMSGRDFVKLGFFMMLSMAVSTVATYVFMSWLNREGGTQEAGYFQAGWTLFNRYAGLILTALAVEYYPRLASVVRSRRRMETYVSHELGLMLGLAMPLILAFMAFVPLMVRVLYAEEFMVIAPFVTIAIAGTVFRVISWCMAYTMVARGDGRLMIVTETLSAALYLVLNIVGYRHGGLVGLGWAYIVWYLAYSLSVSIVYFQRYKLRLSGRVVRLAAIAIGVSGAGLAIALFMPFGLWVNGGLALLLGVIVFKKIRKYGR